MKPIILLAALAFQVNPPPLNCKAPLVLTLSWGGCFSGGANIIVDSAKNADKCLALWDCEPPPPKDKKAKP